MTTPTSATSPAIARGSIDRRPFNPVVARLTARALLGRRRVIFLGVIPLFLLLLALVVARTGDPTADDVVGLLNGFALTTVLPLLALIAGTGAIGPEVDDGSILYLLAKPVSRYSIAFTKYAVAVVIVLIFGCVASLAAGTIIGSEVGAGSSDITLAFTLAVLVAGIVYTAIFFALSLYMRMSVVVGLIYILIWEGLLGNFVPGVRTLSVHQWALAFAEKSLGADAHGYGVDASVKFGTAIVLCVVVTVVAIVLSGRRLQSARLTGDE